MRFRILAMVGLMAIGACSQDGPGEDGFTVVATTTILGDIVANVAGSDVEVEVLMPIGVDPHDFQPSAAQVAAMTRADLVVANGGGLEEGFADVLESARQDGVRVVEVLEAATPLSMGDGLDPHFWLDPVRVGFVAELLATELGTSGSDRVNDYLDLLDTTDRSILAVLGGLENRTLVTNHDAFSYFAARYDLDVVGVVIPGGSTIGEPSSQDLAHLVAAIEEHDVRAIFVDTAQPSVLAEAVAAEVGYPVEIVELYTGSLGGPGTGAETLVEMLLLDAGRMAEAMGG